MAKSIIPLMGVNLFDSAVLFFEKTVLFLKNSEGFP